MACNSCKSNSCNGCGTPGVKPATNPYYVPTTGCGLDACSNIRLGTDSVVYTGQFLSCTSINTCDTLTSAIAKLDYTICNQPALQFTTDNGLTKTDNNVQLGGTLIKKTVLTTSVANTLAIKDLVTEPAPLFLVTQDANGILKKTSISIIPSVPSTITANNGLAKVGNNIELGGPLVKATTITTNATNTLTLSGLVTDASPSFIITQAAGGQLVKTLVSSILPSTINANNGLSKFGSTIQLGGTLNQNTNVLLGGYDLSFLDTTLSLTGIIIRTGAVNETDFTTNTTELQGKLYVDGKTWLNDNVGIGVKPYNSSDLTTPVNSNNARLFVARSSGYRAGSLTVGTDSLLTFSFSGSETQGHHAGISGRIGCGSSTNKTLTDQSDIAAIFGYMQFSNIGNISNTRSSALTAVHARTYFNRGVAGGPIGGTVAHAAGIKVSPPIPDQVAGYGGTITNSYGLLILNQRSNILGTIFTPNLITGNIINSYGIYQDGINDINQFRSNTNIFDNLPTFANNVAAAALATGTIYKTATGELRIKI
jgi:hypothetical protein